MSLVILEQKCNRNCRTRFGDGVVERGLSRYNTIIIYETFLDQLIFYELEGSVAIKDD